MNRLIVVLMLALVFALSIARFAHAQDAPSMRGQSNPPADATLNQPPASHIAKPNHRQYKPVIKAADVPAPVVAASTTDASVTKPVSIDDTEDVNGKSTKITYTQEADGSIDRIYQDAASAGCTDCQKHLAPVKGYNLATLLKGGTDIKNVALTSGTIKDIADQQALANKIADSEKKRTLLVAECVITDQSAVDQQTGILKKVSFDKPTDSDSDGDSDNTADDTAASFNSKDQCYSNQLAALKDSTDKNDKKIVSFIKNNVSNELQDWFTLSHSVLMGTASPADRTKFFAEQKYYKDLFMNDPNLKPIAVQASANYASSQSWVNLQALSASATKDPRLAGQFYDAASNYVAAMALTTTNPDSTELARLTDINNAVNSMKKIEGKAGLRAGGKGVTGDLTAAIAGANSEGAAAVAAADANYADAAGKVSRIMEGIPATVFETKYDTTPPTSTGYNPAWANTPARFTPGSGGLAAASGIGSQFNTNNSWANTVASPSFGQTSNTQNTGSIFRSNSNTSTSSPAFNNSGSNGFRS